MISCISCAFLKISCVSNSRRLSRVIGGGMGRSLKRRFVGEQGMSDDSEGTSSNEDGICKFCHEDDAALVSMDPVEVAIRCKSGSE